MKENDWQLNISKKLAGFLVTNKSRDVHFLKAAYTVSLVVCNVSKSDGGGRGVWSRRQCPHN